MAFQIFKLALPSLHCTELRALRSPNYLYSTLELWKPTFKLIPLHSTTLHYTHHILLCSQHSFLLNSKWNLFPLRLSFIQLYTLNSNSQQRILLHFNLLYSTLLDFTPLLCSAILHFTLLYSTLFHFFTPFLLYFTLRYSTLLNFTLLCFALLISILSLLHSTSLYFSLLYSKIIQFFAQ